MSLGVTFAACALAALAAPPRAEGPPKLDRAELRRLLEEYRKKHDVPALGAAIVTSRGVKVLAVVGVRKRGEKVKAEEGDCFHLGSETKAFTATLIAVLISKKRLSYGRTLAEAFPDLAEKKPEALRKVTLAQCLTHRAGLQANLAWFTIPTKQGVVAQREEALRRLFDAKPVSKPGEKFLYSNAGYVVAAAMAERATKKSWEELLAEHLTKPLKMTTVGFGPMGTKGKIDQPYQHDEKGEPVAPDEPDADNPPVLSPAGRVHCSLGDWGKFVADQLAGARGKDGLLPAASYKALHSPSSKGEDYTPGGWCYESGPGGVELGHDGSNGAGYATAVLLLKADLAVLVVCNQGPPRGEEAAAAVRDALVEKLRR
jgi:CubicO group peptidase (beta-lactamase class C family)